MSTTPYAGAVAAVKEQRPVAEVFGTEFILYGRLTALDISELARAESVDARSAEGQALLSETFRAAFGDHTPHGRAEYGRFRRHVRGIDDIPEDEVLIRALRACMEAHANFPTQQPSRSPGAPSTSTGGSKGTGSPPDAQVIQGQVLVEEGVLLDDEEEPQGAVVVNIGRRAS